MSQRGFTLIELMVTLVVLAWGRLDPDEAVTPSSAASPRVAAG